MPKAKQWRAPDLTSTGILAAAMAKNGWDSPTATQAEEWYGHFLCLRWEDSSPLIIMDRNADLLWHTHREDFKNDYEAYCTQVIGNVLPHTERQPWHTPAPGELSAAEIRYKKHGWWPIPYSSTSCH